MSSPLVTTAPSEPLDPLPVFAPVARGERIDAIDFVRGVALLGILLVNVATFFSPIAEFAAPARMARLPVEDQAARLLVSGLCFTKFISTFSMLFGFGLMMQATRAEAAGQSPWGFAARRLGWLAVFGLIHALVFWYGDILFVYACLGFFVVLFRRVPPKPLLVIACVLLAYFSLMRIASEFVNLLIADLIKGAPDGTPDARGWNAMISSRFNIFSDVWIKAETVAYGSGPWLDALTFRVVEWLIGVVSMAFGSWTFVVGQFLVGMWLFKERFFDPDQSALRRRVLVICLPLGLLIEALAAGGFLGGLQGNRVLWSVGGAIQSLSIFFLPLGYVAALALIADALPRWLSSPVACAGRMALTVYLSETLIATFIAYHWGLGYFGQISPWRQVALGILIWTGLVVFSRLWLTVFSRGPMEALWRLLGYGPGR